MFIPDLTSLDEYHWSSITSDKNSQEVRSEIQSFD